MEASIAIRSASTWAGAFGRVGQRAVRERPEDRVQEQEEGEQRDGDARAEGDEQPAPFDPGRPAAVAQHPAEGPQQREQRHILREQERAARKHEQRGREVDEVVRVEERIRIREADLALPSLRVAHPAHLVGQRHRVAGAHGDEGEQLGLRPRGGAEQRTQWRREAELAERRHHRGHDGAAAEGHEREVVRVGQVEAAHQSGTGEPRLREEVARDRRTYGSDPDPQLLLRQPSPGPESDPYGVALLGQPALHPSPVEHLRW